MVLIICNNLGTIRETGISSKTYVYRATECATSANRIGQRSADGQKFVDLISSARNCAAEERCGVRYWLWIVSGSNDSFELKGCEDGAGGGSKG